MTLKQCEFEEAEYRGPLFNQLQTTNLLWEPGQVFEQHIGIDHALFTTHAYLHSLHGYRTPLSGVVLSHYNWDYIWGKRLSRKRMPSFRLNVFIRAKRPQYGRYAPKALREQGLTSPYWRFEITPHQQVALERLQANLKKRAIVCYACPAFHKESLLHKWTVEPRLVENSTFPDAAVLAGHSAWNYSEPGTRGIANVDPTYSDGPSFLEKVKFLIEQDEDTQTSAAEDLQFLSNAVLGVMKSDIQEATYQKALFFDGLRILEQIVNDDYSNSKNRYTVLDYGIVLHFCYIYRLNWLIVGKGQDL